ncbi:MAG: MASE1 domain-containing protein [Nitrospirae bacterium]|nr:MASE1 domain-containing protein [Candidatus Manganitrophaceae bacterium]
MKKDFPSHFVTIPLFIAVYFLSGRLGLSLAFFNASATAVWPPAGLSLAALLFFGFRLWPGVFIGAFLVNLATAGATATSLGIAVGNTLEAVVGAWLVRFFANGCHAFDRPTDIFKYVLATAVSTAISASFGVTSLLLGGVARGGELGLIGLTWWLGDMVSDLTVAPFLLIWGARPFPRLTLRKGLEATLLLLFVFVIEQIVFGGWFPSNTKNYPFEYLVVPFLLWVAFRMGRRGAAAVTLLMSAVAMRGTLRGFGPFFTGDLNESLLLLQAFIGTMTLTILVLASVISQRRRTEEALSVSEERFAKAFRSSPDAQSITRQSDGAFIEVNDAWVGLFGYRRDETLGRTTLDLDLYVDPKQREEALLLLEKGGSLRNLEVAVRRRSGEVRQIQLSLEKVALQGEPCLLTTLRDVTEQKKAESALRESEDRLRLAVESTGLGTWDYNPVTGALAWSVRCKEIFGLPPEAEVDFSLFLQQVHPDDRERVREAVDRAIDPASGGRYSIEFRTVPLQGGQPRWLAARGQVFFDSADRPVRFIGTVLDITDQKHSEEELKQKTDEAEAASRVKSQLISNVSHELRTPLNSVLGYTDLLLDGTYGVIDGKQRSALEGVRGNAGELLDLINQILDFSKVESGKVSLEIGEVEIAPIAREVVAGMWPLIARKSFSTDLDLPPDLPVIESDPQKIRQILSNLLSNAIKFTEEGEIRIAVRNFPERGGVEMTVEDTGIGIPSKELPRIFDAFHQADATATREFGGTGLGLTIVRDLVGLLRGEVHVTSEIGKGSRFSVYLPYRFHLK